jgi:hypothetical protein
MDAWTIDTLQQVTANLHLFSDKQQNEFLTLMNSKYPPKFTDFICKNAGKP